MNILATLPDHDLDQNLQQNLRWALDQHAIVSTTDRHGWITGVNDKFCEISGYERHELLCSGQAIPDSGLSFFSATAGGSPSLA